MKSNREIWVQFACAALSNAPRAYSSKAAVSISVSVADLMLAELEQRDEVMGQADAPLMGAAEWFGGKP